MMVTSIQLISAALALLLPHGDAAGKGFPAEEGFLVLTWDGALAPLLVQTAEEPHPWLPEV